MIFDHFAVFNVGRNDYRINFRLTTKRKAGDKMKSSNLSEEK